MLHPQLSKRGIDQYLCDLLSISSVDDMIGDHLSFQEVCPAVNSDELHMLANRILPYNGGDIHKAVFAARNILNTVPKRVDDLVDYVTKERFDDFAKTALECSIVGGGKDPKKYDSLDKLATLFSRETPLIIDMFCNSQMERSREIDFEQQPGITYEQKMLFSAANYYLNHAIGFKCNTVWLACFLGSQSFGCPAGWVHGDGQLCQSLHFGFKDDVGMVELTLSSLEFISDFFNDAREESEDERFSTAVLYMQTLIFTLDCITKQLVDDKDYADSDRLNDLLTVIDANDDFINHENRLLLFTLEMVTSEMYELTDNHVGLLQLEVTERDRSSPPPKHILSQFDAWNFMVFESQYSQDITIAPLFLASKYDVSALDELADKLLSIYSNGDGQKKFNELIVGFFQNYLFSLINENSDDMGMYDDILTILKTAALVITDLEIMPAIQIMAELGHRQAICEMKMLVPEGECNYWRERLESLDNIKKRPTIQ